MNSLQKYSNKVPSIYKLELTKHFFLDIPEKYNAIELNISIRQKSINIKELSSYLDFIYRVDGHLSEIGYSRYVHNPSLQIEIDEIRFGSWEIIMEKLLYSIDGNKLLFLYLTLKYLPKVFDSAYRFYETMDKREDYLEKREKRKYRKKVKKLVNEEPNLLSLEKKQKEKLINIIDEFYIKIGRRAIAASRFAEKFIKEIKLNLTRKRE